MVKAHGSHDSGDFIHLVYDN